MEGDEKGEEIHLRRMLSRDPAPAIVSNRILTCACTVVYALPPWNSFFFLFLCLFKVKFSKVVKCAMVERWVSTAEPLWARRCGEWVPSSRGNHPQKKKRRLWNRERLWPGGCRTETWAYSYVRPKLSRKVRKESFQNNNCKCSAVTSEWKV